MIFMLSPPGMIYVRPSGMNWLIPPAQNDVGHKTDAVTVHGLDAGDRKALLDVYAHKVNDKMCRNAPPGTLIFNNIEHMNVRTNKSLSKLQRS
jgi:hypothetical protein